MRPEELHIKLQLQLMQMVDATGEAVGRVLQRAVAQAVALIKATTAPLSVTTSQIQLAQVMAVFRAAADDSYRLFVDRTEADAARWVAMSEREIAAELRAAQQEEREDATRKVLTAAALLLPVVRRTQASIRAASQMGALELTIAAQEPAYSLRQGMARAFVLPDGTPLQAAIKAPSAQAGTLFERRMRSAIINGQTSQDLARQLLDEAATPVRYLTNEARTGAQSAANAVNYDRLWETVGLERAMFVATLDSRTTELCRSLNGRVYRLEDAPRPPLHRNCVPGDALVTPCGRVAAVSRRWHEGFLYILRTADGGEAKMTPNHPVLTDRGWQPAKKLKLGDRVFQSRFQGEHGRGPEDQQVMTAEDLATAFREAPGVITVTVPVAPEDFHGDGEGTCTRRPDQKVGVVSVDRSLAVKLNSPLLQLISDPLFSDAAALAPLLSTALERGVGVFHAPYGVVSLLSEGKTVRRIETSHASELLRRAITKRDPLLTEDLLEGSYRDVELFGDTIDPNSAGVEVEGGLDGGLGDGPPPVRLGAVGEERLGSEPGFGDSENLADGSERVTLSPEGFDLVDLVGIEKVRFAGHVYNLETELATYGVNSLLTHNCRSVLKADWGSSRPTEEIRTPVDWLRAQPADVQDRVLGEAGGNAFRETGSLVDPARRGRR